MTINLKIRSALVGALLWVVPALGQDTVPALQGGDGPAPVGELSRVLIDNTAGGLIRGSRDGGETWVTLGHVVRPILGGIWLPTVTNGVKAYNFLRGPSNVFATAVNAVHLRFSDPEGYQLPVDPSAPLVIPQGASILPKDSATDAGDAGDHVALTDMAPGTGLFGPEWSPRVGSRVLMGDGERFGPIRYGYGPDARFPSRSKILIVVDKPEHEVEWIQFENRAGGRVIVKRKDVADEVPIAKVVQPVMGIGRFIGSDFVAHPGVVRANHAGVLCFGTTDRNSDPASVPTGAPINDQRGGFQVVPSHHYQDSSMQSGGDHPFVYLVVGPLVDPPSLVRYDMGVDGQYPIFRHSFQAGGGSMLVRFKGDSTWFEMSEALKAGKFRRKDGARVDHLRGYIPDALSEVTDFRYQTGF